MSHPIHLSRRVAATVAAVALGGMLALGGTTTAHAGDNYPGARAAGDNYPGALAAGDNYPGLRAAGDNYPGHQHLPAVGRH